MANEVFYIKTCVKQGCILSPFLFCLAIDWIMKGTYIGAKSGIIMDIHRITRLCRWPITACTQPHRHTNYTEKLVRNATKVDLHVNKDETKTMRNNCQTADRLRLGEQDIKDVTEFTYLGAKVTKD